MARRAVEFVGLVLTDKDAAAWSVFGLLALGCAVLLISHKVYSGKL